MNSGSGLNKDDHNFLKKIEYLEKRLNQIEAMLGIRKTSGEDIDSTENIMEVPTNFVSTVRNKGSLLESRLGESGLGWLGSIVLLFGITFIVQYIQNNGLPVLSSAFGFTAAAALFIIRHFILKPLPKLSFKLLLIGFILLFYVTMKLYFFSEAPVIQSSHPVLAFMSIVIISLIITASRIKSELLAFISYLMIIVTAVISDTTHFMFALIVSSVIISLNLLYRLKWWKLLSVSVFITYLSFIIWYILLYNKAELAGNITLSDNYSIAYLFLCVSGYSVITLLKPDEDIPSPFIFITIVLNGLLFSLVLTMYIVAFYFDNYVGIFLSIFLICFLFSVALKKYSEWKYTPAFYSLYGFVALSTAIYGIFGLPHAFLMLCFQSLLVVSMAVWFRSRIIVFMNFFLYLMLLMAYYFSSEPVNVINFSFAIVPLITARIVNWQSERLDIKTDILRNSYLAVGFFTVLYALCKAVPGQYVTLSWTAAALVYFLLSILIHNIKYRWMAIFTMLAAAAYLFIVDLANVDIIFRILAFMFLAVISIAISIFYTRNRKKLKE